MSYTKNSASAFVCEIGDVVDKLYLFIPLKCLTELDSGYTSRRW